jgi:hypothetical protein
VGSEHRYAPGPSLPVLAAIVLRSRRDALTILEAIWRRYGDLSRVPAPFSIPRHLVVHPDQVRQVLIDRTSDGPTWRQLSRRSTSRWR